MIVTNIKYAEKYFSINKNFEEVFSFLRTINKDSEIGSYKFDGFKANVVELVSNQEKREVTYEAHRKYIDIHYIICGREEFGYANIDELTSNTEYNAEKDCIILQGKGDKLLLREGQCCVVYPEDAHAPMIYGLSTDKVKKVIVKIALN